VVGKISILCGVVAMLMAAGCGDASPEEKCQDLVAAMCGRVTSCLEVPSQQADCIRSTEANMSCAAAKSVTDSYDTCMDELRDVSCDVLLAPDADGNPTLNLPASCHGVLKTSRLAPPGTSILGLGLGGAEHLIGL
jgi:hypothetical protein